MNEILTILRTAIYQSAYDYLGWNTWLGEPEKYDWRGIFFRVLKFILDYPVSIFLMVNADWNINQIAGYYVFKQFGGVDMAYMIIHFILKNGKVEELNIWWMWWTPLGWHRTEVYYNHFVPWKIRFIKGKITRKEAWLQTAVGLLAGFLIIKFQVINFIINLWKEIN